MITELWVAMDKDGKVFMYTAKPIRRNDYFGLDVRGSYMEISKILASANLTFENSPKPVKGIQI